MRSVSLPGSRFVTPPPVEMAAHLVRAMVAVSPSPLALGASRIVGGAGWSVVTRRLGAPTGGLRGMMAPRAGGGFLFVIDPRPAPMERDILELGGVNRDLLMNLRLAHELGHVFFYEPDPPHRRLPARTRSEEEEQFCDAFAFALTAAAWPGSAKVLTRLAA